MRVVHSARHLEHDVTHETFLGLPLPANEVAERAERIRSALLADGGYAFREPTEHGLDPIVAVHDPAYVRFIETAWADVRSAWPSRPWIVADTYPSFGMFEGMSADVVAGRPVPDSIGGRLGWYGLDSSNPMVAGTAVAARAAVDVALTAVDLVLGSETVAYGLCRPPGHHAARTMAGGYCFFNNAAIAAEALVRADAGPVAILDVDYHHGNGTQQIFWRRGDVRYASIHADPRRQYPFFLGHADEIGEGPGTGANRNLPQPAGLSDAGYLAALDQALGWITEVPGDVVVVSLGFDTFGQDPIGDFGLTTAAYHACGSLVRSLGRRLVILQEGGYHRPSLGENARAWLRGAEGRPYEPMPAAGFSDAGTRMPA